MTNHTIDEANLGGFIARREPRSTGLELSAVEQAELVRKGELSARELVQAALERIERLNPTVNAFVTVCPERALAEADTIAAGDARPLCGVPIAVKDLLSATEGLPTTHGSAGFGDWVADHDAAHVRRLRDAGAIIVGKTNTPELGLRPVTENDRFGATRNPWNTRFSAGGSSGGSAAATAAGMVALADGSDLGGSIRIPASCCGLVGLKPSRGRVSIGPDYGAIGLGTPADGVLTRTVGDTATALDAIAAYAPGDHHFLPAPVLPFALAVQRPPDRVRVRVALTAPLGVPIDAEPLAAVRFAADSLAELGHDVAEGTPDWDDEGFPATWGTFMGGTLQHLVRVVERLHGRPVEPDRLEPATRAWAIEPTPVTLVEYLEAAERLWAFSRRVIRAWAPDAVLLTPTLTRLPAEVAALRSASGVTDDAVRYSVLVRIWNVTGQPAITVPLYRTADGIPVGVQLVGPPGRDDLVIGLAAALEATAGRPPRGVAHPTAEHAPTT
jgi:amidase